MAIPYFCKKCGHLIGMEPESMSLGRFATGNFDSHLDVDCPGEGKHPEPERNERTRLFGLIKKVSLYYPETKTTSTWEEYAGSRSRFKLWLAIVFGTKRYPNGSYRGVTVNGKWAWWDPKIGFYGDGIKEFERLPA